MGRRPRFTDSGGVSPGKMRVRVDGNSELYRCNTCEKDQVESVLAKSRAGRVRCRHCGQIIYPVKEKSEEALGRTCLHCFTTLRSTNPNPICSLCLKKASREGKLKAILPGGKYIHAIFDNGTTTWCDRLINKLEWGDGQIDCPICIRRVSLAKPFPGRPLPHPSTLAPVRLTNPPPPPPPAPTKPPIYMSLVRFCERFGEELERKSHERASVAYAEWLKYNPAMAVKITAPDKPADPNLCPGSDLEPRIKIMSDLYLSCSVCSHSFWINRHLGISRKEERCPCCISAKRRKEI